MEGNIAVTYTLIYRFLKQQSKHKAAEAVKKAAKAIVVLRDDIEQEGPPLEDIIKEWKTKENTKSGNMDSSSKDSDSSDDSSSDSEDSPSSNASSEDTSGSESEGDDTSDSDDNSDDSDDSDETTTAKKLLPKAAERDTSATLSSAGENAQKAAKQVVQIPKKNSTKNTNKATKGSESDGSDPDSSDSDSSSKSPAKDSSDAESSSSGPGSSSSSDSSDEDEANENEKAPPNRTKTTEGKSPSTSESSSESEDDSDSESQQEENTRVAKKRKTSKNGAAVTTAVATGPQRIARASQGKEKPPPNVKERFQRVKVQNLAPDLLLNNGYQARGGAVNDYGERAHRDLVVTRGAGFRKEKNKKKRGSYRGGAITMESHSIKFDF